MHANCAAQLGRKKRKRCGEYDSVLGVGERLGLFARRARWDRLRCGPRQRYPSVRWGEGIFPECRPFSWLSAVLVTKPMLQLAIEMAVAVVTAEAETISLAFRAFAAQQRGKPPTAVEFDARAAVKRLRTTVLGMEEENPERLAEHPRSYRLADIWWCYGESSTDTIWISNSVPMAFDELLNTLIHEALHDTTRVDGEFLTCNEEHEVMFLLGRRRERGQPRSEGAHVIGARKVASFERLGSRVEGGHLLSQGDVAEPAA